MLAEIGFAQLSKSERRMIIVKISREIKSYLENGPKSLADIKKYLGVNNGNVEHLALSAIDALRYDGSDAQPSKPEVSVAIKRDVSGDERRMFYITRQEDQLVRSGVLSEYSIRAPKLTL